MFPTKPLFQRRFDRKANKCVMVRRERKGGRERRRHGEGGEREARRDRKIET